MKIIIAGATGFIGSAVLKQSLKKNSFITHVYAVVRKPLADRKTADNPKCTEIIHEDFEKWPEHLLELFKQEGVRACIWCIGGAVPKFPDLETAQRVNIAMPQAAAEAFAVNVAPTLSEIDNLPRRNKRGDAFRFIYLSVSGAEQNQFASLWTQAQTRKMKGAAEKNLLDFAESREAGTFEVYALRLGRVLAGGQTAYNIIQEGISQSISEDLVAKCCINLALDGRTKEEGGFLLENVEVLGDDWADINTQVHT